MASLWQKFAEYYYDIIENKSDPRVKNWFMMSGPIPTIFICILYAYIVKILGPKFMKNRNPFVLRRVMIYYNLFLVMFSIFIFHGALKYGWWNNYSLRCEPVDYSDKPLAIKAAELCWWFYISKLIELFDTIIFVLRKKNSQISSLHVYHHGIMAISSWIGVKFVAGGHTTFMGLLNSFVHIIMYGYYLLAAFGPKVQPYLWWKKYLTALQMIQFLLVMIHAFQLLFIQCEYPSGFAYWIGINSIIFFYLFRRFYIESYAKKSNKKIKI